MNDNQLELFFENLPLSSAIYSEFPNDECTELEYKSGANGFPLNFWETYSAFANTNGGFIILGVSEKKQYVNIDGLESLQIPKFKKAFFDLANNPNKVSKNICTDLDVKTIAFKEKTLLACRIPVAKRTDKPIFLNGNPIGNTYKRNHEGDYKCTNDEVRRMLADSDSNLHQDNRILNGFTIDDIDLDSLRRYRQLFSAEKPGHTWLTYDDVTLLKMLGGYRVDRESKKEGFTLAGLIMFGKNISIVDPECAPSFFPEFREILTNDASVRWTDRVYPDGTWETNLFQFYLRVWPKLTSTIPKPFNLKNGIRQDETPAHVALREAFVNALIHTDYSAPGSIIIEQKTHGFLFTNPGTLLVTLHQYYLGGISECRNPNIQKMFLMIGSAEKAGSGVSKILSGWRDSNWTVPRLRIDQNPDRISLQLPMVSMLPEETLQELRNIFGEKIDTLPQEELMTLVLCCHEGETSNNRLQFVLNKHSYDITKMLQELTKKTFIVPESKGRWTTYHINKDYDNANVESNNANIESIVESNNAMLITQYGKKLSQEELEELVVSVCKDNFKTIEQISNEIERSSGYTRNIIVPRLVKSGKLIPLYKFSRRKGQAYKSANNTD